MNELLENKIRKEVIKPAFEQYERAIKLYEKAVKEFKEEYGEEFMFPEWETPDIKDYLVHEIATFSLQKDKNDAKNRKK